MKKFGQKGFTLIEGLLIFIALGLVVGIGYYVYSVNQNKKEEAPTTSQNVTKEDTKPAEQEKDEYFEIKELGVKFKKSATLANPVYFDIPEINTPGSDHKAYLMSTKELALALEDCNPGTKLESISKSALSAGRKSGQYPSEVNIVNNGALAKQFSNFYISYNTGGSQLCADGIAQEKVDKATELYSSVKNAYIVTLKTVEQIN